MKYRSGNSGGGNPFKMRKSPGKGMSKPNPRKQRRGDKAGSARKYK